MIPITTNRGVQPGIGPCIIEARPLYVWSNLGKSCGICPRVCGQSSGNELSSNDLLNGHPQAWQKSRGSAD